MRPSLAHLLNQAPEFADTRLEQGSRMADPALPPAQTVNQGQELSTVAALDAVQQAFARVFGGVWLPGK